MNNFNKIEIICSVILSIPDIFLDSLSTEDLLWITNGLFRNISFCNCVSGQREIISHKCQEFSPRDIHNPACKCCQTWAFTYFLGRLLERLASDGKLELLNLNDLRRAKIRDRIYNCKRNNSKFEFEIIRHFDAFRDPANMRRAIQRYIFDFNDLSLKEIPQKLILLENDDNHEKLY